MLNWMFGKTVSDKKMLDKARSLLKQVDGIFNAIDEPILDSLKGIRGDPVRHSYMIATVWYLQKYLQKNEINILEIGSYIGSSIFTWDFALREYFSSKGSIYSIDPLSSFLGDNDYEAGNISNVNELAEGVKYNFAYHVLMHNMEHLKISGKAVHLRAMSSDALSMLRDGYFDIVYIDGDHGYEGVSGDIRECFRLVNDGGILCGDDLELQGSDCDMETAKKYSNIDYIVDPKTDIPFHPGVTLAVWENIGQVSSWDGYWAMRKIQQEWRAISLKDAPLIVPPHFPKELASKISAELPRMRELCDAT